MPPLEPLDGKPSLSVVVIGRNEGERLSQCLQSVQDMRWQGQVETIYVDSNSSDDSPQRAEAAGAQVVRLDTGKLTAARGRNAGWRRATSPLVLFLDGDTILDPDFPRRALGALHSDADVAVVWGHRREIRPRASVYNRVFDLDWISRSGITNVCGGDALVRRCALVQIGGYDESLIAGEEPEMCRRLRGRGHKILHIDAPMVGHDLAILRFGQYWSRSVRTGYAYAEVSSRFRGQNDDALWRAEARGNILRATALLGIVAAGLGLSAAMRSALPLLASTAFLALLVVRTAYRAGWKSTDWGTRLLYGMHSHLQQIPILWGQLKHRNDHRKGRQRHLIEYKGQAR
ncbi:MAG TPA: glycosyltransferase family 2 protein [Bryobacteraceae bacterium]|nr:glycosyltransferase family 2 protein [Bryobacteraceae bacterium]